uniref:Ubiquitin-fold modifier-conjugating enzyme 1 n=1 Tax=Zeugodacus cucurbitae TaxID=28588 RepID=A0A0A1WEM4_ZEUCU
MQEKASCSTAPEGDIQTCANATVDKAINEAIAWIVSDPAEQFLYKYPHDCEVQANNSLKLAPADHESASTSAKERQSSIRAVTEVNATKRIDWFRIDEFSLHRLVQLVYDYLSLWRLTPNTQYQVRLEKDAVNEQPQGCTYSLSAYFSRNLQPELEFSKQLAMTKVNFKVHISHLLPKFYPIMMTYRFENSDVNYYALGRRRFRRLDFQRFFIDMALETKLGLYAQILKTIAFGNMQKRSRKAVKNREERERANVLESAVSTLCICSASESGPDIVGSHR